MPTHQSKAGSAYRPQRLIVLSFVLASIFVAFLPAARCPLAAADFRTLADAAASIQPGDIKAHIDTLADDAFEGREAGKRGGQAAATYVMKQLEANGLPPGGERGSYFQSFGAYRNVLALIPGSDERLKHEVIILGAHYDHVGYGTQKNSRQPGYIHNGADDNASGTAALLAVARALGKLPEPPRRTILLAFWDAEEKGLLGSKHWVADPTVPLENVKFKVNMDMVGRLEDDTVQVYGTRTAAGLRRLVTTTNRHTDLRLSYVWWINPRSDHFTFVKQEIPVLMLHTGMHNDYHQPSDEAHKLNIDGIARVAKLLFHLGCELAERDELPAWRGEGQWESGPQRKRFEAPVTLESSPSGEPLRLGISWRENDAEPGAVTVVGVAAGSPAERGGVRPLDRVYAVNGRNFPDSGEFQRRIAAARGPIDLLLDREGRFVSARIELRETAQRRPPLLTQ